MLWDTHMHSQFSGDSKAPQESMIQAARQKNVGGICFTDHLDMDYPGDPSLFLLDLPHYAGSVRALQAKYKGDFPVYLGVELGLQPQLAALHTDILSSHPFDFVIGSSHLVHGADPYYASFYQNRKESECYLEYFESILENIRAFDGFDVYGHIDYVVRYGPTQNENYSYKKYQDVIDAILKLLVARGKGIEINTGGFRYGLGHPNPTEEILARYRALGGEIITVGADAHAPEYVAYAFEKVPGILRAAGFRYFTVYRERKPEFYPLPES